MVGEIIGLIGGGLFLFSWILQAWETHRAQRAMVSLQFFLIRLVASLLLLFEAWRLRSYGFLLVIGGTILLILYNIHMISRRTTVKDQTNE